MLKLYLYNVFDYQNEIFIYRRMEDRHVILHDLAAHLPENLQHKINPEDHVSFYAGKNFKNSYKPSQDLNEVLLLRRTILVHLFVSSFGRQTDRETQILLLLYND